MERPGGAWTASPTLFRLVRLIRKASMARLRGMSGCPRVECPLLKTFEVEGARGNDSESEVDSLTFSGKEPFTMLLSVIHGVTGVSWIVKMPTPRVTFTNPCRFNRETSR